MARKLSPPVADLQPAKSAVFFTKGAFLQGLHLFKAQLFAQLHQYLPEILS